MQDCPDMHMVWPNPDSHKDVPISSIAACCAALSCCTQQALPLPSVAKALSGQNVHWTFYYSASPLRQTVRICPHQIPVVGWAKRQCAQHKRDDSLQRLGLVIRKFKRYH